MIHATWAGDLLTAATHPDGSRTVAGVAVPYGVEGVVSDGRRVIFHRGALDAAARPPLLRDHDIRNLLGRVVDATDAGPVMNATARVSRVPDGDAALTLAADGALGMFSVGAEPTEFYTDADGVLHITAADWRELSLVPFAAFAAAQVHTVTAQSGDPTMPVTAPAAPPTVAATQPDPPAQPNPAAPPAQPNPTPPAQPDPSPPAQPDPTPQPDPAAPPVQAAATVPVTAAGRAARPAGQPDATIAQVAGLLCAARGGNDQARGVLARVMAAQRPANINAALADITLVGTDNIGAAWRPAYQAELVEIISWGSPLVDALRQGDLQRGDFPNKTFNRWVKTPEVALQTAEKTAIHSVKVSIEPDSCPVNTWAGGNDISQQTLDLGSPSFVEDYIRAAGIDYAQVIDTYAVATLLAAAIPVTTTPADTFIGIVGKLVGALTPAATPPGGLFLAVSYDVGVGLIGVPRDEGPAFWDGNVNFGSFTPTVTAGGLSCFVDPNLPARTYLLGQRQGATWYDLPGTPFNLRAVNVGLLGLDIAVYGYGALGIQYPGAFATTTVPVAGP